MFTEKMNINYWNHVSFNKFWNWIQIKMVIGIQIHDSSISFSILRAIFSTWASAWEHIVHWCNLIIVSGVLIWDFNWHEMDQSNHRILFKPFWSRLEHLHAKWSYLSYEWLFSWLFFRLKFNLLIATGTDALLCSLEALQGADFEILEAVLSISWNHLFLTYIFDHCMLMHLNRKTCCMLLSTSRECEYPLMQSSFILIW